MTGIFFNLKTIFLYFTLTWALFIQSARACPVSLSLNQLSQVKLANISKLRLFRWDASVKSWQAVALQIERRDEDGQLYFKKTSHPYDRYQDKFLFSRVDPELLAVEYRQPSVGASAPCKLASEKYFEIQVGPYDSFSGRAEKAFYYLFHCNQKAEQEFPNAVDFWKDNALLQTDRYRYFFDKLNYLLFDRVDVVEGREPVPVARESDMHIYTDQKKFFDLEFDSTDIESEIVDMSHGPVFSSARLSFFMRVLFFKIDLNLITDVSFFRDSANIPMVVTLPANGSKYLNPGSGILYSWQRAEGRPTKGDMPEWSGKDYNPIETPESYCKTFQCFFSLNLGGAGPQMDLDFRISRHLVKRAFYPMYISDVQKFVAQHDWSPSFDAKNRSGVYFEVSNLTKGSHGWDLWLRLHAKKQQSHQSTAGYCPQVASVSRKSFKNSRK